MRKSFGLKASRRQNPTARIVDEALACVAAEWDRQAAAIRAEMLSAATTS